MEKLVSIVIPVYNSEKYISECLESILNQTYKKIEIILVNDGSKDSSLNICEIYKKKDSRIKLISQKNLGVSSARNNGISYANGEYIIFIDSDDTINKMYIEKMVKEIENKSLDLVICNYNIMDQEMNKIGFNSNDIHTLLDSYSFFKNYWENYHKGYVNAPWNKIYRTKIIKEHGIIFPIDISMGEDGYFNISYLHYCSKISILGDYLYNFRNHPSQSTKKVFKNHFYMLDKIFDHLENEMNVYSLLDNKKYLEIHLNEYYNELKLSLKYLLNDHSLNYKEKKKIIKEICTNSRTMKMKQLIKTNKIKDKVLLNLIKHNFFYKGEK